MKTRLPNTVPYEAVVQLSRHLLSIRKINGYNFNITQANVVPKDMQSQGLTLEQANINIEWTVDQTLDTTRGSRVDGFSLWESTVFLDCFLMTNRDLHKARTDLFADIFNYFRSNRTGAKWTLPTENGIDVVRELWFETVSPVILIQETKPLGRVEIKLKIFWGMSTQDANTPF